MKFTLPNILPLWLLLAQLAVSGQFTDIAGDLGLDVIHDDTEYGNGLSFYDFNHDGWDDLTIANGDSAIQFYVNNGGIPEPANFSFNYDPVGHVVMILWGDIENDGDSDLLTTELEGEMHLWRNNGDFSFEDITEEAGLITGNWRFRGAAFGDYDHDGFLDLYVTKYYTILNNDEEQYKSKLFHNNGNATFTDVTVQAGVDLVTSPNFQPVFMDCNHDGWEDLYLVIDRNFFMNRLFQNNHDGTFTDVSVASGANPSIDAMSGTIGDFDNDTDLDIFVTNGWPGNHLYENNGDNTFSNIASSAGVMVQMICWGSLWLDYDNDSWRDLYVGTTGNFFGAAQSRFFINNRDDTFSSGEEITGIQDSIAAVMVTSMGDLNNDGYYDFATNSNDPFPSELWLNDGGDNHYISIKLEGVVSNKDGVGSWIHCFAGGQHFTDYTRAGDSFNSQSSSNYIFGLDSIEVVDSLIVEWSSGTIDKFYQIPSNQKILIQEGISWNMPVAGFEDDTLFICPGEAIELFAGSYDYYIWNTGDTTASIQINSPGEYFFVVPGLFSIPTESEHIMVFVSEELQPEILINHASCFGFQNGSIELVLNEPVIEAFWVDQGIQALYLTNLPAGQYQYEIIDFHDCIWSGVEEVTQPEQLILNAEILQPTCATIPEGSIQLSLVNGDIENLLWSDGSTDTIRNGLAAGYYFFEGDDSYGCPFDGVIELTEPDSISVLMNIEPPSCYGGNNGSVQLAVSGGLGEVSADWNGLNPDSLESGVYPLILTDSVGCSRTFQLVVPSVDELMTSVTVTPEFENANPGSSQIVVTGGTPPYQFLPAGDGAGNYSNLAAGSYQVIVTDDSGCSIDLSFQIDFISGIYDEIGKEIFFNRPSENLVCCTHDWSTLKIFNLDGRLIVEESMGSCLDITALPKGVYILRVMFFNGEPAVMKFVK